MPPYYILILFTVWAGQKNKNKKIRKIKIKMVEHSQEMKKETKYEIEIKKMNKKSYLFDYSFVFATDLRRLCPFNTSQHFHKKGKGIIAILPNKLFSLSCFQTQSAILEPLFFFNFACNAALQVVRW